MTQFYHAEETAALLKAVARRYNTSTYALAVPNKMGDKFALRSLWSNARYGYRRLDLRSASIRRDVMRSAINRINTDKAREALRRFADEAEAIATERDNRKAERRAKLDQPHGLAVGDVLRSSWGYDQTNTDYFEVTRVIGKRTVEVRKLAEQIEQTAWAQGNSVPVPGQYVGAPMRRQVDTQGAVNILHATYGRAYKMEPVATVAGVRCFSPSGWSSYA
jgi:hypothetical protein